MIMQGVGESPGFFFLLVNWHFAMSKAKKIICNYNNSFHVKVPFYFQHVTAIHGSLFLMSVLKFLFYFISFPRSGLSYIGFL